MSKIGDRLERMFSLEGKIILMTGAAGGIGSVLARGLSEAGGRLALCDLRGDEAEKLASGLEGSAGFEVDVLDSGSIRRCVAGVAARFGRIDVLINCAGINKREGLLDVAEETYDRIMGINLKGVFMFSQAVGRQMVGQGGGNIINIGSHNDEDMLGGCSVYGATKSGVVALTRAMAVEWAQHNIRANAISPGHILTPLTTVTWEHPTRSVWLRDRIAMRRPGKPGELVGICVMLASDASSYMTGQAYHVDGGCLCGGDPWDFDSQYKTDRSRMPLF
ncbi:MAG: SDR family oxidoreductase [Planctomycetota bacterium]|jgi:NAD(P)-dependent dehydrogenase (short-subunit alcohol dehydrogenase family)|nr:SDR family oxidoreductase [Planctomycetota bacterium]